MRVLGAILVLAGILALAFGGFSYTKREKVLDVGPIEAVADKKEHVPVSPIVGGAAVVAGLAMLVMSRRSTA